MEDMANMSELFLLEIRKATKLDIMRRITEITKTGEENGLQKLYNELDTETKNT